MDRAIRVCRSYGLVDTAKESIYFDMAKQLWHFCNMFQNIKC